MGFADFLIKICDGFRFVSIVKVARESVDPSGNKGFEIRRPNWDGHNMMGEAK